MVIVGAKGHAIEVLQCFGPADQKDLVFFDDVTPDLPNTVLDKYALLRTAAEAQAYLATTDNRFVLGLGSPALRRRLAALFRSWGGELTSVRAPTAIAVANGHHMGPGLNLMHHTMVSLSACLGEGVLLNAGATVHHDVIVGDYCEISPGARLLGRCRLGHSCNVGSSSVILPDIIIGNNVIIGAGAVVTRNVADGSKIAGVPARPM